MREMSVREANQNFSQLIAAAEAGETIVITKNGKPVARVAPQPADLRDDPQWRDEFAKLQALLDAMQPTGLRVDDVRSRDAGYDDDGPSEKSAS
jgi:prevent-host-death family protein